MSPMVTHPKESSTMVKRQEGILIPKAMLKDVLQGTGESSELKQEELGKVRGGLGDWFWFSCGPAGHISLLAL